KASFRKSRGLRCCAAPADVGPGQERAIEQRAQAVVPQHRSPRDFRKEAFPEDPFHGPPGVVGPQTEEEGGAGAVALEQLDQAGHAVAGSAPGVDVHLQRQLHTTRWRASAISVRYASKMRRSASRMPTRGRQRRSRLVLSIFGTRFCMSW